MPCGVTHKCQVPSSLSHDVASSYLTAHVFPAYNVELDEQSCRRKYQQRAAKPDASSAAAKEKQAPADPKETAEREKAAYEYCIQRRAAKAAERQSDYAWWGVALSVPALIALFGTLVFTAWSASFAGQAAKEMAREVEVQIRFDQPLLFPRMQTTVDFPENLKIDLSVTNYGRTPAILTEWSAQCKAIDSLPAEPKYPRVIKTRGIVLRPDGHELSWPIILDVADALAIRDRQATSHLWGYFKYRDALSRTRITGFAYRCDPSIPENHVGFGLLWTQAGGDAYNYDREESQE